MLEKIKNDVIKLLLNLNIVLSTNEKENEKTNESKRTEDFKKLVEMKNVPVARVKNLSIVTEIYRSNFFKSF